MHGPLVSFSTKQFLRPSMRDGANSTSVEILHLHLHVDLGCRYRVSH